MVIISDTSCINNLLVINKLNLLHQIFGEIIIPPAVYDELVAYESINPDISKIDSFIWIKIKPITNLVLYEYLLNYLDNGEAQAITLAQELKAELLVVDESAGREIAKQYGLVVTGTIGVIVQAKKLGIIPHVKEILDNLRNISGFWINQKFYNEVLQQVNEF